MSNPALPSEVFLEGQHVMCEHVGYPHPLYGVVRGISSVYQPVIGATYIVELDSLPDDMHYPYTCIVVPQSGMTPA